VWSLDPPVAKDAALQPHKTDLGHEAIIMEVPVTRDSKPAGTMKFGVVLVGRIEPDTTTRPNTMITMTRRTRRINIGLRVRRGHRV
jgi:hypothetical protein